MASAKVTNQGDRIHELLEQIEAGVQEVFVGENYRKYLAMIAKLHPYSVNNCILIYTQMPDATMVAGYNAWQKNFNRHVVKGESGIRILGYRAEDVTTVVQVKDPQGNQILDADGKPKVEEVQHKVARFFPTYVFDVSQTDGEPLPTLARELQGEVKSYNTLMAALHKVSPVPISLEAVSGSSHGYFSRDEGKIVVDSGMSETQTLKTTIHEVAHALLHGDDDAARKPRAQKETEAESVAFICAAHLGVDTSDYSFEYLASWSSGRELEELKASLDLIAQTSRELINAMDTALEELRDAPEAKKSRDGMNQEDVATATSAPAPAPDLDEKPPSASNPESGKRSIHDVVAEASRRSADRAARKTVEGTSPQMREDDRKG